MKKLLKISAVGLIIFALVTNLYGAMFSFYGIKTNNLEGAVWASSLSTTDYSGTSGGGTSSSSWFNTPKETDIYCGTITYTTGYNGNGTAGAAGTVTAPNGSVSASVAGGYVNSSSSTGSIQAHWAKETRCTGPLAMVLCSNVTGINACQ